ncbi:MAG: hypothetical protein KC609_21325 [Myxococcales bacterium]|nr:hypothetical protein [Myxococcales bacterium]
MKRSIRFLLAVWLVFALACTSSSNKKLDATESDQTSSGDQTQADTATNDDVSQADGDDMGAPEPDTSNEPDAVDGWNPEIGCQYEGQPCDDENACTHTDKCGADLKCAGTAYTCDDGRECTDDKCDGNGYCIFTVKKDKCFINGVCHEAGKVNPKNPCVECVPTTSNTEWTADDTNSCANDSVCTKNERCEGGTCVVDHINCDGGNPCKVYSCDPKKGCQETLREGPCEDGDLCNGTEMCVNGTCMPAVAPTDCDDDNPCTKDSCDSKVGCIHEAIAGTCETANKCVAIGVCKDGACDLSPSKTCASSDDCGAKELCYKGECVPLKNCDDGNSCTEDLCEPSIGCYTQLVQDACCTGSVNACDDKNACTTDTCIPGNPGEDPTCTHENNTASCDDGDPCTVNDTCANGVCKGTPKDCDDKNPCTDDSCVAGNCVHTARTGTCDDGRACSTNDKCVSGKCVGDETGCQCTPSFSNDVTKITSMQIGSNGQPGEGLNVDELSTCAPTTNCSAGIDNAMSGFAALANTQLATALTSGQILLLLEAKNIKYDGTTFSLSLHQGQLDPANAGCNVQTQTCQYKVAKDGIDGDSCLPKIILANARITGNTLTAGGASKQYSFALAIPLSEGLEIPINILYAHVEATVTKSGSTLTGLNGLIGGAVIKSEMLAAIDAIPPEKFAELGFSKDLVKNILNLAVKADLTIDGKEAASIGLKFSSIKATITGTY